MKLYFGRRTIALSVTCLLLGMMVGCQPIKPVGETAEKPAPSGDFSVQEETVSTPSATTEETISVSASIHEGTLILVNQAYAYQTQPNQVMQTFESVVNHSYRLAWNDMLCDVNALDAVNRMVADYIAVSGDDSAMIISGYRSVDRQQELMDQEIAELGSVEEAEKWLAIPGHSEHHTGYAVDFSGSTGFVDTAAGQWILEHAPAYGFIQRYTTDKQSITGISNEPWHLRYLGVVHATAISQTDYCLEEYIEYLKQFTYDGERLSVTVAGQDYEIYYANGDEITVPVGVDYEISGNNVDGLVVAIATDTTLAVG